MGAVLVAGVVAAQEYYPVRDVNADGRIDTVDIQEVASSWNTSGSPRGTLVVFTTTMATTGAPSDARAGMGNLCRAVDPDAHFCTVQEIGSAFLEGGVVFQTPFPMAWIDDIRRISTTRSISEYSYQTVDETWTGRNRGYFTEVANCYGWTNAAAEHYGSLIAANGTNLGSTSCSQLYPVACCK